MGFAPVVGAGVDVGVGTAFARSLMAAVGCGEATTGFAAVIATGMETGSGSGVAPSFMAAAGWGETTMGFAPVVVAGRSGEGRTGDGRRPNRGKHRDPSQQPASAGAAGDWGGRDSSFPFARGREPR